MAGVEKPVGIVTCGPRSECVRVRDRRSPYYDRPYTGTSPPRVRAFCGEARNAIVAATSVTLGHLSKSAPLIALRLAGVSMMLGTTAFTQMRSFASSSARLKVMLATAALLAA